MWHASQQLRDDAGGRLKLTLDVCHDWALRSWILSWGPFVRVVSPASLAGEVISDLRRGGRALPGRSLTGRPIRGTCRNAPSASRLLTAFAVIFFGGPSLVRFYTDWLWFGEVGYQFVFATMLRSQGTLFTVAFVVRWSGWR